MKISRPQLEENEINHLRAISQINCTGVSCNICPLHITLATGLKICTVDAAILCLKTNNINPYERLKGESK